MYISKADAAFYTYEEIALATIVNMRKSDDCLGENGTKDLINKISNVLKLKAPNFQYTRSDSKFCYHRAGTLHFNRNWGLTTALVLHGYCHYYLWYNKIEDNDHGPNYVKQWINMISRMYEIDSELFENLADSRNIKYGEKMNLQYNQWKCKYQ